MIIMTTTTTTSLLCIACAFCAVASISDVIATEAVTTGGVSSDNSTLKNHTQWKSDRTLSRSEKDGVVTLELVADDLKPDTNDNIADRLPVIIAQVLNKAAAAGERTSVSQHANETHNVNDGSSSNNSTSSPVQRRLRRRRRSTGTDDPASPRYSDDGIGLVKIDPAVKDGRLRVAVVAADRDGDILAADQLRDRLDEDKKSISSFVGYEVDSIYSGLPSTDVIRRPTVWDLHRNLFIGVLILLGVALFVLAVCCLCFYCCRRRHAEASSACGEKQELKKQPIADEEMVELTPVVPLHSAPPPQQQASPRSDCEQPAADDDENGWIVPLDQLSHEELEQPANAQISKL